MNVGEFGEQLDDNLIQDRYVQLMSSSPGEDTSLDPEYAERLVYFSDRFAKDPRYSLPGFISIPLDLCRIPNGQTSAEGGESFLIPFSSEKNLDQLKNAARDMSENKQNYEEQIAKEVQRAKELEMYALFIGNTEYGELKKVKGFEGMFNLREATNGDLKNIKRFINNIGVPIDDNERCIIRLDTTAD